MVVRRYRVTGRVQGVGYRNFVEHLAGKLHLGGFVRNRRDGSVEVLATGTPEQLQKFRVGLEKGPVMARVEHVSEEPGVMNSGDEQTFRIEFTE